ncbi:DE-cadherin [Coccinella septempunctata]|uniref:DE-cadherin n=1 Tax=Coccinella septempunctata TaxID=41139 RepID=UPI001D06CEC6|nr:DE-cadherin [Coccinella septempunctata]
MEIFRIACLCIFLYSARAQLTSDKFSTNRSYDNHKPTFTKCAEYNPSVPEEQKDAFVLQVEATDVDPPENGGTVTYKIMQKEGERVYFTIDNVTGVIKNVNAFDRDEPYRQKEVYLSIQATDNGRPPLADICTFKVTISDINDNAPSFDQASYRTQVSEDLKPNSEVVRVFAFDSDDGENSRLTYSFAKNNPKFAEYFRIDSSTGVIYLKQSLKSNQGMKFVETIAVSDNGDEPKNNYADLSIVVVGSDKQSPKITADKPSISLNEDFNSYESTLITLEADSNIRDKSVVFELMKGKTRQTNMDSTFVLTQQDTKAEITLGRPLDYETVPDYSLTVIVRNKEGLSTSTTLKINIKDVNDEMPTFIDLLKGSVVENDIEGAVAMQVKADDRDGTSPNNLVKYELLTYTDLFEIDEETGHIRAKTKFDREIESVYHVQVRAYDGAPSALKKNSSEPNSAVQTFQISIEDKNDNAPVFQQSPYFVHNISESSDTGSIVVEVQAVDKDTASLITYKIVDGNVDDAFVIENTTGRIKVNKELDFEKVESYNLTVMAHDGIYNDTTKVLINILNENDEPPVFEKFDSEIYIVEEKTYSDCVLSLTAYDPDIKNRSENQRISYEVQKDFLKIDSNGCLTIIKPLDRDLPNGTPKVQAYVIAYDSFGPTPLKTFAEVNFHLTDINDNAPFLNVTEVVWYENSSPNLITVLTADDYDSEKNGPPFSFLLDDSAEQIIKDRFEVDSSGTLYAKVQFDREERKYYNLPIAITDHGSPPRTGVSNLRVVIGDENDNPAQSGSSSITVYKYEELSEDITIGRVYVEDPDDWDLLDKVFQFKVDNQNFHLKSDDKGMLVMHSDTEAGRYSLEFYVTEDHPPNIINNRVEATVDVLVKVVPKEAVVKSGSIRINGTTIDKLIERDAQNLNKLDILQMEISRFVNESLENVDIFTVLQSGPYIDIRFSAHGSPYMVPDYLNNKISENQKKLEKELGFHMHLIGISECLDEAACNGLSCSNELSIKREPAVVFTNKTSFVGVKAVVEKICECRTRVPDGCYNGTLLDGGACDCPAGSDGPNCEILAIGFSGNSWAMYPTFDACATLTTISLTIFPQTPNGLIFYTGPSTLSQAEASRDFLSLELRDGSVVLKLDFGHGPLEIVSKGDKDLNDGASHDIEITFDTKEVQLTVDKCGSNCLKWQSLPSHKGLLNVNGPLQIGGMKRYYGDEEFRRISDQLAPTSKGFIGCIRDFRYNGFLYNLGEPSDHGPAIHINCNYSFAEAVVFGIDSNFLVAVLVCVALFIVLLLAVVVYRRKQDDCNEKDIDDTRATIINYEDEGGGESDASFDLSVLRPTNLYEKQPIKENFQSQEVLAALPAFLDNKIDNCDKDPNNLTYDDVRHYAYEGDGNSAGSLSSLASCTDDGDLKFNYLSNFGPRFRKLADMYGNDNSDDDSQDGGEESWC